MLIKPPHFFDRLLTWYCAQTDFEDIQGDLYEVFLERCEISRTKAKWLFAFDVLKLFNPFSKHKKRATWLSESYHFNVRNQLSQSVRYLKKYPLINVVKIVGLGLAISAFLYINDYTGFHKTFDHFHEKKDRIYRVVTNVMSEDLQDITAWSHSYLRDIADEFPSVQHIVGLLKVEEAVLVNTGEQTFEEPEVFFSDPEFSEVFSYRWLEGDPKTALSEPNSAVLTKQIAHKYFNTHEHVVGKLISIDTESFTITGVVDDIPANSDLKFDLLIPFNYYDMEEWMFIYILLQPGTTIEQLESSFAELMSDYNDNYTDQGISLNYQFENIADVHFSEPKLYDTPKVDRERILLFQLIGWIILLTASVNYINLYSTQLLQRIQGISVQVVVGASKKQLFLQFGAEAFLYMGMAMGIGVLLTITTADFVSQNAGFQFFSLSIVAQKIFYLLLAFLIAIVASALYALALTTKKSSAQLFETKTIKAPFRKALIGVQFALSFSMILATVVIFRQTSYIQNQPLGFKVDQIISFQFPDYVKQNKVSVLKEDLAKLDFVQSISQLETNSIPGTDAWVDEYHVEGFDQGKLFEGLGVDENYFQTLKIDLIAGEFFEKGKHTPQKAFMVNRSFIDHFGWEPKEALGKKMDVYGSYGRIVGITENFYFNSPHQLIQPLIIRYHPTAACALVRLNPAVDLTSAISRMELVWSKHLPGLPFNFSFLKSDYERQFQEEHATLNVLGVIAGLVITLSLLGMYAILLMLAKVREKELGIRKVNGANTMDLFHLFSREFIKILLISIAAMIPLVWIGINNWLSKYPTRITFSPLYFVLSATFILFVACMVIYIQASKSYQSNTIDALKYE